MILYALACANGHRFESWFRSGAAYDEQAGRGLVTCPVCQSSTVTKTIMAPAVLSRGAATPVTVRTEKPAPAESDAPLLDPRQVAVRSFLKAVREKVLREGEDVGEKFPEQARQMHDGDIPARPIHGQATVAEARDLIEDGIPIVPLPMIPEELN